jgi:hypothetical protein
MSTVTKLCLALATIVVISSAHNMAQTNPSPGQRDINAVLKDHEKKLMAIPDVVGVYIGVLADGRTPCLKIMLARETDRRAIPQMLDGYPVIAEVTGEIRPRTTP